LAINGEAVSDQYPLPREPIWTALKATWDAPADCPAEVQFTVVSHINTGAGNDYVVDDLYVLEIAPVAWTQ